MLSLITAGIILNAAAQTSWTYNEVPGPLDNPLKGWAPFVGEGTAIAEPYSIAYFNVTWKELEPAKGSYKFEEWERSKWDLPAAKGKFIIFRLILDYPGQPTGVPQWLINQGLKMNRYTDHGGGQSPDYSDPKLQTALLDFVKQLGQRYNKNPRVAFIQAGGLGHWGEWHTWPKLELFATPEFQTKYLDTLLAAFPDKKVMARNPATEAGKYKNIGFHDDMIPEDTLGPDEWMFLPTMKAAGRDQNWKTHPTGGEMVPAGIRKYMGPDYAMTLKAIKEARFSWIGPACPILNPSPDEAFTKRIHEMVRMMGYQYHLTSAQAVTKGKEVSLTLKGVNQGVAPFYYQWPVELALIDAKGTAFKRVKTNIDIRSWQPGTFNSNVKAVFQGAKGRHRLALGIISPITGQPSVSFASSVKQVEKWQILGEIDLGNG